MLKFFRHIRYNLINKNKTVKYLKYAIGEILLVVIGILIAIAINNWNQNRLEKLKSIEYHKRMAEELDLMIQTFKWDSTRGHNMTKRLISSVNSLEKEKITEKELDTLKYTLKNYFQFVRIENTLNTYEEIKSSGDLGLIYNRDLRRSINMFITRLNAISKIYDELASQVNKSNLFDKYIRKQVYTDADTELDFNLIEIQKDKVLINTLSRFADNWKTKKKFAISLIKMAKELKSNIEVEIEND